MDTKTCLWCNKEFSTYSKVQKFCCNKCATASKRNDALEKWLKDGELNYRPNTMIKVKSIYRQYIDEEQGHKCAICGVGDSWNGKHLTFVLDHIDGNSSNHNRNNLRLICPNCDSQLETYKYKHSKHSSRDYRIYKDKKN